MKVLIVDDSRAMQQIVKRGLEKLGYDDLEIVLASNGMEALALAKEWKPNLILSDWHMPEMTGLELMHELSKAMLDIDIGFVTTESSPERIKEATDAGALFVICKPFDVETLHNAVLPALQGKRKAEAGAEGDKTSNLDTEQSSAKDPNDDFSLVIPKSESLQKALALITVKELKVTSKDIDDPKDNWLPCIIGLFGLDNQKNIKVVVVFDILASIILGANANTIPKNVIDTAIKEKVIPKDVIVNCERALQMISLVINREVDSKELTMISMSTLTTNIDKLAVLVGRKGVARIDYSVSNKDYSDGRIIILCP
jgi:CheY-like chemotaxis protein